MIRTERQAAVDVGSEDVSVIRFALDGLLSSNPFVGAGSRATESLRLKLDRADGRLRLSPAEMDLAIRGLHWKYAVLVEGASRDGIKKLLGRFEAAAGRE